MISFFTMTLALIGSCSVSDFTMSDECQIHQEHLFENVSNKKKHKEDKKPAPPVVEDMGFSDKTNKENIIAYFHTIVDKDHIFASELVCYLVLAREYFIMSSNKKFNLVDLSYILFEYLRVCKIKISTDDFVSILDYSRDFDSKIHCPYCVPR